MSSQSAAFLELCRREPSYFRSNLIILGPNGPQKFGELCVPFQKFDFDAIDPALKYLAGVSRHKPDKQMFYFQRSRGASKTSDRGMDILYLAIFASRKLDMIVVAEDKDQAQLLMEQIEKVVQFNGWITSFLDINRSGLVNKTTNTRLKVMTADVASSYGITPDVILCDEWSHWSNMKMFTSLYTSFIKTRRDGSIFVISTNAGEGRDWKWETREAIRNDEARWHCSILADPPPWYTKDDIEVQRKLLPSIEFRRLVMNEWVEAGGEFLTLEEADACIDPTLFARTEAEKDGWAYVASVDYAQKIDRTVGVVGHVYDGTIIVDRMDVLDPRLYGGSIPVSWVERWMAEIEDRFGGRYGSVTYVLDRHQLVSTIQRLTETGYDIIEFEFAGGKGNDLMARNLMQMVQQQRVRWYEHCGAIYDDNKRIWEPHKGRNDLSTELASLHLKRSQNGLIRFDHAPGGHDDRAFALGALCLHVVQNCSGFGEWDVIPPTKQGGFRIGA